MSGPETLRDKLITVFGGGGFIGNYVAQSLLQRGARLRIASRKPEKSFSLQPLADLGQLQFARCDVTKEQSLAAALDGAHGAINLVGTFDANQMQVMGDAPGAMGKLADQLGLEAFVHISAIGANLNSDVTYERAKAAGEQSLLEAFPKATILRPSIVFGKDDNFLNMFGQLISMLPALPVFAPDAKLQLVYVDDVADAATIALADPKTHGGKTYELGGPEQLTMMEINQRIAAAQRRSPLLIPMPDTLSAIFAALPGTPMTGDQWTMLKSGNTVSGDLPGLKKLGIEPKPLGLFLDKWMTRYRKFGRFGLSNDRVAK